MRCTSVRHASVLVGTRRLNQLATTAAVLDMFEPSTVSAARVVEHTAVVGSVCRYLAVHFGLPRDELATCGFLHDIGKLMLLESEDRAYSDLLDGASPGEDRVHELERVHLGFDHAVLAAHVLAAWNIPEPVPRVVARHHHPARAVQEGGLIAAMVQALRLADALAYALAAPVRSDSIPRLAQSDMARYLDLSEAQLAAMWPDLELLRASAVSGKGRASEGEIVPRRPSAQPISVRPSIQPRTLRPSRPVSGVPMHFPCIACGQASFGSRCPACGGYVCPEHEVGAEQWCSLCAQAYREQVAAVRPWRMGATTALFSAVATYLVAVVSNSGRASAVAAAGMAAVLSMMLFVVIDRALRRSRFLRERAGSAVAVDVEPPNTTGADDQGQGRVKDPAPERIEIPPTPALPLTASFGATDLAFRTATTEPAPRDPDERRARQSGGRVPLDCDALRPGFSASCAVRRWFLCVPGPHPWPPSELATAPTERPPPPNVSSSELGVGEGS
jgi:putative nucleotidyltransferase with HDIG domain